MIFSDKWGLWVPTDAGLGKCGKWVQMSSCLELAWPHVRKWDLALDIGAHIGIYSRGMAKRFNRVIAFEPYPPAFDCLVRNLAPLGNVQCAELAAGDTFRQCAMMGNKHGIARVMDGTGAAMVALDILCDLAPDFVKIDVDGYEVFVLDGMKETIRKHKPVILIEDFSDKRNKAAAATIFTDRLVPDEMAKLGYELKAAQVQDKVYA